MVRTQHAPEIQPQHQEANKGNVKTATLELNYKTEQSQTFRKRTMAAERAR